MSINKEVLANDIHKIILEVIRCNEPYDWISTEEPFYNMYNNKISFDHSGDVVVMSTEMLSKLKEDLGRTDLPFYSYSSELEEFLSDIRINRWEATYMSNHGKRWVSYHDLVLEKFDEYKYSHYNLYDEDGNELDIDLEFGLDDVLYEFIKNECVELYYNEVLHTVKK